MKAHRASLPFPAGKLHRLKGQLLSRLFDARSDQEGSTNQLPLSSIDARAGIVGFGLGPKLVEEKAVENIWSLIVYVRHKDSLANIPAKFRIPAELDGTPTDVIETGDFEALQVHCGSSVGHHQISAGTLGCLVARNGDAGGARYILSNNHVLANSNNASTGDSILQPGAADGGQNPRDRIAELTDFEPITFGTGMNTMDAAIAKLDETDSVRPDIFGIGRVVNPPVAASIYQTVRKCGRTTRHTFGIVSSLNNTIQVRYGAQSAWFDDQVGIVGSGGIPFARPGDSGSLICEGYSRNPVGLLFAGGGLYTFGAPIASVLQRFQATII